MYQRSQPDAGATRAQPLEMGLRTYLEVLVDKSGSIHGRVDALREHCFGPFPEENPGPTTGDTKPNLLDLCQIIEFRLRKIDDSLEFLTARL